MLGSHGETVLIDWGLAKWIGDPEGEAIWPASARGLPGTRGGHAMGTPRYLSPEQAAGRPDRHGPASDVYSLGAILYELITGRAPFEGSSAEAMELAQVGDFPTPRQVRDDIDPILEAACLKAMALDPEDRHPRALDLGDEVVRWMEEDSGSGPCPDPAVDEPGAVHLGSGHEACLALVASSVAPGD